MRTTIIALTIACLVGQLNAQERTNRSKAKLTPVIGSLTTATGWCKNQNGRWISRPNRIPVGFAGQSSILIDFERHKTGVDNFIYYQLRKIIYDDDTSMILIKKFRDGYYQYEAIQEDWNDKFSCEYYVFDAKELTGIEFLKDTSDEFFIRLKEIGYTGILINGNSEIEQIIEDYQVPSDTDKQFLYIKYFYNSKKNLIDFSIYTFDKSTYFSNYGGYFKDNCKESFGNETFSLDEGYFETNYNAFKKLFLVK